MSFDSHWLFLRETVDHRVRPAGLTAALTRYLEQRFAGRTIEVLDLACGTGSNLRYLAPRLPTPQRWTLVDLDQKLLEHARERCAQWPTNHELGGLVKVETRCADLADDLPNIAAAPHLVTASALLDLFSEKRLDRLVRELTRRSPRPAFLAATIYNGTVRFDPPDHDDARVTALFDRSMGRDKGFGPALGGDAVGVAQALLEAAGCEVTLADSTWSVDRQLRAWMGADSWAALAIRQIEFFCDAARSEGEDADAWTKRRMTQIEAGTFSIMVGHTDLLGLDPAPP